MKLTGVKDASLRNNDTMFKTPFSGEISTSKSDVSDASEVPLRSADFGSTAVGAATDSSTPTATDLTLSEKFSDDSSVLEPSHLYASSSQKTAQLWGLKLRDPTEPSQTTDRLFLNKGHEIRDYSVYLHQRYACFLETLRVLENRHGGLLAFSEGYKLLGFNRVFHGEQAGWLLREWLPGAIEVRLIGDFNNWNESTHPLTRNDPECYVCGDLSCDQQFTKCGPNDNTITKQTPCFGLEVFESAFQADSTDTGVWTVFLPDDITGSHQIRHKSRFRLRIKGADGGWINRVSAWSRAFCRSPSTDLLDGMFWYPTSANKKENPTRNPKHFDEPLKIYQSHIGIAQLEHCTGTYNFFRVNLLPRIKMIGYNTILVTAVLEHPVYSSFGFHVTNYLAPSSRFGTPEDFKDLVRAAHEHDMLVLIDIPFSHTSLNVLEGLNQIDGTNDAYFSSGREGYHRLWEGRIFDFKKIEVLRHLLSCLRLWIEEYGIDGVCFTGVTSMVYRCQSRDLRGETNDYLGNPDTLNEEATIFLMLATKLIHLLGSKLAIAADSTEYPGLCLPIEQGGLGFDYRYRLEILDKWFSEITNPLDEKWDLKNIFSALIRLREGERTIVAVEDGDSNRIGRRPLLIALFSWESLHTHAVGGVAPHVTELAAGLTRLGHHVHVFTRSTRSVASTTDHFGVQYHECCFELNSDFVREMRNMCDAFVWCMRQTEESIGKTFDVCHAHDWLTVEAILHCKKAGRRCVMTMHSTEYGRCGNNSYGGTSLRIREAEGLGCAMTDRIVCVSGALAEEVRNQYGIHENKLKVIHNGIHCGQFDCDRTDVGSVKTQYGIGVMDPMFLFVGRLVIQKAPDLLLEAIPHVLKFRNDVKFIIVGEGHMGGDLEARTRALGIGHSVRFVGKKSGKDLRDLYRASDAVVVPSRNEPFGIVVLEAWSASKPVIATTSGGPRDFVTANVDGILVDPNVGSISWGCCEILKNFEHSKWMGGRGRVKAAFSFSWDAIAQETAELYYEQCNLLEAAPCYHPAGNQSVAFALMGEAIYNHMTIFDEDHRSKRGLALHKVIRLATAALGGDGYLTFMGCEFGHPEWIDLPRSANNKSSHHARRRWDLADDKQLKFKHFQLFEIYLLYWKSRFGWTSSEPAILTYCDNKEKVVVVEKGDSLIVFNFHPVQSYINRAIECRFSSTLSVVLDTDHEIFGGSNNSENYRTACPLLQMDLLGSRYTVTLDLPCRSGMVLTSMPLRSGVSCLQPSALPQTADHMISQLQTFPHKGAAQ